MTEDSSPSPTNPRSDDKPYAPPSAFVERSGEKPASEEYILADCSTRLGAFLIDGLLVLVLLIPVFVRMWKTASKPVDWGLLFRNMGSAPLDHRWMAFCGLLIYQWYLISTSGQSIGKKWLNIKIVKMNGEPVDFVHGVLLRSWIFSALLSIPYAGDFISGVDGLMIFGKERRCLHDRIAGTKVVLVRPKV